jgi:hypothetical protein
MSFDFLIPLNRRLNQSSGGKPRFLSLDLATVILDHLFEREESEMLLVRQHVLALDLFLCRDAVRIEFLV